MWLNHLLFVIGLLVSAYLFALVEIQIEGREGWAAGLPTWRIDNKFTRLLNGNRPLTGYHVYLHLFVLSMLHSPFALGLAVPSWRAEARIFAFLILFWTVEDFLWFVANPAYGLKRFTPKHIPWHRRSWWGIMPRDYWIMPPIAGLLYWLSYYGL